MLAKVNNIINAREDDVRCYSLPEYVDLTVLGKQIFTEGVLLLSAQGKNRVL
jgi:CRISPR-associated protein Cas2